MNKIIYSVDVEKDLHSGGYNSIRYGLKEFEKLCDRHKIKPVLYITSNCIKDNKDIFLKLKRKGWQLGLHGHSHKRFDEMKYQEKEDELKKGLFIFRKYLKTRPIGFRAPQHSIDNDTLDLLDKHGFKHDSSYTPLNLLQLLFFPKKTTLWAKLFFSRPNSYKIRKNLLEIPASSLFIPFVSLTLRVFPRWLIGIYLSLIKLIYKTPVFYAHSWDFIELKESRIDRSFSHKRFLSNLDYVMYMENKNEKS